MFFSLVRKLISLVNREECGRLLLQAPGPRMTAKFIYFISVVDSVNTKINDGVKKVINLLAGQDWGEMMSAVQ